MSLTIIVGDVGSGKTLLQTYFAIQESRPVYSNYPINIPNYNKLEPIVLTELNDALVVIDEMFVWLNSRVSSAKLHEFLSAMLFQMRKSSVDYIGTAQLFRTIDVNFREMCDYVIQARNDRKAKLFHYEMLKNSSIRPIIKHFNLTYEKASAIFPYYSTYSKVPVSPDVLGGAITDRRSILPAVETHISTMLKLKPANKWTRSAVDGYCTHHGLSKVHASTIYNELRYRST